ncbi:MAG: hypothetical protein DI580_09990 [Cutibacterium acnes]|nr:MAG: hypothetical protein DI580_09990 [Cutibacterium acnes]
MSGFSAVHRPPSPLAETARQGFKVQGTGIKLRRFSPSTKAPQSNRLGKTLVIQYQLLMTIVGF